MFVWVEEPGYEASDLYVFCMTSTQQLKTMDQTERTQGSECG